MLLAHGGRLPHSPRRPGPLRRTVRKRVYFAMMGTCLALFVLAWAVVGRYSDVAAMAMSAVALCIPPFAAIIANTSPPNRQ